MTTIYQIGIIDTVTAGFGTVMVQANSMGNPVYLTPEHPEEAVQKIHGLEVPTNGKD